MNSDRGPISKTRKFHHEAQQYHHVDDSINDRAAMGGKFGVGMSPAQTNTFYPTTQMTTEDNDADAYLHYVQAMQDEDEDDDETMRQNYTGESSQHLNLGQY